MRPPPSRGSFPRTHQPNTLSEPLTGGKSSHHQDFDLVSSTSISYSRVKTSPWPPPDHRHHGCPKYCSSSSSRPSLHNPKRCTSTSTAPSQNVSMKSCPRTPSSSVCLPLPLPSPMLHQSLPINGILTDTPGHYTAELLSPQSNTYTQDPSLNIDITVHEVFDSDHQVVQQRGSTTGRFTFSAADSGEHRICFTPSSASVGGGWLSGGSTVGPVKFTLDLVIGETSKIEATDKGKMGELVQKVRDLNSRLQDIKREQVFQRVSSILRRVAPKDADGEC
jgi:hypothetical protein